MARHRALAHGESTLYLPPRVIMLRDAYARDAVCRRVLRRLRVCLI